MGRWSKERKAQEAAKAAAEAEAAARAGGETPQQEQEPVIERRPSKNPRNQALEEIVASRQPKEEPKAEEPKAEEPKAGEEPQETPKEEPKAEVETPKIETPPTPKVVRVKVDGQEFDVPESEVEEAGGLRAYQKDRAAENRLKKANEALAQVRQLQMEAAQKAIPQQPQISDRDFIAQNLQRIREGTPEEGFYALQQIFGKFAPQTDPNLIVNHTVSKVNQQSAIANFRKEYQDILAVPALADWAAYIENREIAKFPPNAMTDPNFVYGFDWNKFYSGIGNHIRGAVGRPSQPPAPQQTVSPTSPTSEKEARKASIVQLPTASARAEPPKEPKPETREDILNEMRKKRGQSY